MESNAANLGQNVLFFPYEIFAWNMFLACVNAYASRMMTQLLG